MERKFGSVARWTGVLILAAACVGLFWGCKSDSSSNDQESTPVSSSRAYTGHASDADMNNFVREYPKVYGTRLDDCQTCHASGYVTETKSSGGDEQVFKAPCTYCHYIPFPPTLTGDSVQGYPTDFSQTLNPYGTDYLARGRDQDAVREIGDLDSDGDGASNSTEINASRYPGNATSKPGQAVCEYLVVSMTELQAMPAHTQFGLANTTKQQFDFYATYTGVKIKDLLQAKGISLQGATGLDILAPDGFSQSFTLDQINNRFPAHRFYSGFGVDPLGSDCAFVEYPAETYGYGYGDTITDEQWHIMAYQREGLPLEESYMDPASGKIEGEGPLRNVTPPGSSNPDLNTPDRGKNANTAACTMPEWNYNPAKDHNAFLMTKGAVIIRIQPMPTNCEEFDIQNGGWAMVDAGELLIYGHGVQ